MRVLGFEIRKSNSNEITNERAIAESFDRLRQDIEVQKKWLSYLHGKTEDLHKHAHTIFNNHTEHRKEFSDHRQELLIYTDSINAWISYLHKNHQSMEKDIRKVEDNLKLMVREDLARYHTEIIKHVRETLVTNNISVKGMKEEILSEVRTLLNEKPPAKSETILPMVRQETAYASPLTPPEEEIVRLLFNENSPMTYEDIARKTGKSVNSIRVYMNSAKSKRDLIEEFRKPNGEKIFSVKNKEKVKTLFNLN